MKNAIERTLEGRMIVEKYGDRLPKIREKMLAEHPLDHNKDEPMPQWAIDILKDPSVGYRSRIKIVMIHQYDITGTNPSVRFVSTNDMSDAPDKEVPKSIKEFRASKTKAADEYLKKLNERESKK